MKVTTSSVGGRAPPRRNSPRPAGCRSPGAAPVLLAQVASSSALLRGRQPRTLAGVDLGLLDPAPQRLVADTELAGHPRITALSPGSAARSLSDHPHSPLLQLRRIPLRCALLLAMTPSSLPRYGASGIPRPIHIPRNGGMIGLAARRVHFSIGRIPSRIHHAFAAPRTPGLVSGDPLIPIYDRHRNVIPVDRTEGRSWPQSRLSTELSRHLARSQLRGHGGSDRSLLVW